MKFYCRFAAAAAPAVALATVFAALVVAPSAPAQSESLASIFTNTANSGHTAIPRRPSILFIDCHGLGYGDLSCYGQTNFQTPNLDRLAAGGMRFTNYRAPGDDYSQSLAALMAGHPAPLAATETTLAERLRLAGYDTAVLGEWTLGAQPWTQGFDEFAGFLNVNEARNYYSDFIWHYFPPNNVVTHGNFQKEHLYENDNGKKGLYLPNMLMSGAANFVRIHAPDRGNHFRPFFLLVTLPLPESVTPGKDDFSVPTDAPFTDEPWPQAAKNRAALMTRFDADVGRLLEQLKKSKMTNNVAIVVAGAAAPEPFAHTNLNFLLAPGEVRGGTSPERLRVPMIVQWPGHVPAGAVSSTPCTAADFAPTALQMAYAKAPSSYTGVSLLPVLEGRPPDRRP